MSSFRVLVERLRVDTLRTSTPVFSAARARRPALDPHPSLASVLGTLADEAEDSYPQREALTRALLEEHRETSASLWASALVLAYYPMLSRLRYRLVGPSMSRDELDQIVVTAFLAAVNDVPLELDRLPMRLRQRTERQVFAFLRKEREHLRPAAELDDLAMFGAESLRQRRSARTDEELFELSLLLDRAVARGVSPSSLEVVEATVLRRELLRSYVERVGPDDDVERERTYQRLKRQRSRTLRRLRALLQVSPIAVAAGF